MTPGRVMLGRVTLAGVLLHRKAVAIALRVLVLAFAIGACVIAWRFGGGADRPLPPLRPSSAPAPASAGEPSALTRPGDGYEVSARLVELAKDARFDLPQADAALRVMKGHSWQQKPAFIPVDDDAARFVTTVALRTGASEAQRAMPVRKEGTPSARDARVWQVNEWSFDQREALVAPAPGTITFRVNIPQGAKLTFAEGTLNATPDVATTFTVSVLDSKGTLHDVHRHVLQPSAARGWTEMSCDLSAFAGQQVELRLATDAAKAAPVPKAALLPKASPLPKAALLPKALPSPGAAPVSEAPLRNSKASGAPASAYADVGAGNGRAGVDSGVVREALLARPGTPVALWGNPTILAKTTPRVPYNVLWIVVEALRPDVIASFHDDAEDSAKRAAPLPPLEALLPKVPGLTPEIDDLAKRGVRFTHAYSAGSWTRPSTLAMLAGARSSELGIDTTDRSVTPAQRAQFYGSDPPLLSLVLRRHHVTTRAFVNNAFMVGYAPGGIDMGFERVADHRYRTRDTVEITEDASKWIRENKDSRFFAFVNFNSPHEPYSAEARHLERVPSPPAGPKDELARRYMGEAAKDDEAIGVLMRTLDESGLRDRTIVVVTANHGETLSSAHAYAHAAAPAHAPAHAGTSGLDKMPSRDRHAASNFEETTKVPIVVVAPGLLPADVDVKARVRSIDIAPTVLDLLGVEPHARMSGASLVPLAKGQHEPEERVVVSEGGGSHAIMHGRWRMIVREGPAKVDLFDLVEDPGERRDLAAEKPELVAEMTARLEAALKNAPVAGGAHAASTSSATATASSTATASATATAMASATTTATVHLRFVGGSSPRRVSGGILVGDERTRPRSFEVHPIELGRDAFHRDDGRIDIALRTSPSVPVGLDIIVDPPGTPIAWELWLDDTPWPAHAVFGGPFGLLSPVLRNGIATDEARLTAQSRMLPTLDPPREVGLFITRERPTSTAAAAASDEPAEARVRLLGGSSTHRR